MDAFINSLPVQTELIDLYILKYKDERNIITKAQVTAVKAKNWIPKLWDGSDWVEYEGGEMAESITLPSPMSVVKGQTIELIPTITPANAATTLTWSSDDKSIATVNSEGIVTGVRKGNTFINVETDNGKTAYCKLTVTAPEPTSISLPTNASVSIGRHITLTATVTPEDAETTLTWESDDETVVKVSNDGVLTGISEGLAFVTVSTANGLTSNICKVNVELVHGGISTLQEDGNFNVPIFSLYGQRLTAPRKGINIIRGKKIIIK